MSDPVRPHRWKPTRLPHPWDSPDKNTGVGCHFPLQCVKVKSEREVAQSCLTLSDPMDCSLPGSSVHGIFQARVLEWGAIILFGEVLMTWSMKSIPHLKNSVKNLTVVESCLFGRHFLKMNTMILWLQGGGGESTCCQWSNLHFRTKLKIGKILICLVTLTAS